MIRIFHHYVSKMAFALLLMELGILLAAAVLAGAVLGPHPAPVDGRYLTSLAFALVVLFSMSALGMYQHSLRAGARATLLRLMPSFGLGFLLMHALMALRPDMYLGRASLSLVFATGAAGVALTRLIVLKSAESRLMESRLLFVGAGATAGECIALARGRGGQRRTRVVGCIPVPGEAVAVPEPELLAGGESLLQLARRQRASEIVVTVANRRGAFPVHQLLECALRGVRVIDAATFFEREACQIRVDSLQPSYKRMLGFRDCAPERTCTRVGAPAVLLRLELAYMGAQIRRFGGLFEQHAEERTFYPYFFPYLDEAGITDRLVSGRG